MMKKLKKILYWLALFLGAYEVSAQSVTVGEKEFDAHPSAILDIQSTSKGVLIPRLSFAQRTTVAVDSGSIGLLIYQTDSIAGFYYFDGQQWKFLSHPNEHITLPNLAEVAKTGDYNDLKNKPDLFSGNYEDLSNKPDLFSKNYEDLSNKPNLFSGNYNDLLNKPNLFSGDYSDLKGIPEVFDSNYFALKNIPIYEDSIVEYLTTHDLSSTSHTDIRDSLKKLQIDILSELSTKSDVSHVHDYLDLENKPSLFSGNYTDLKGIPAVFDSNYFVLKNIPNIKDTVIKYGFDGNYLNLSGKPSIRDTVEKYRNVPPFTTKTTTLSTNPGSIGKENTIARGDHTHTITPAGIGAAATKHTHGDIAELPIMGNFMFFAHEQKGTGDGSSWANAKKFSSETYTKMPANTSALLLGDGTKKYDLKSTITIVESKPVFGGFIGNGLLRQNSEIVAPHSKWLNVRFSKYATIFDGSFLGDNIVIVVDKSYMDGIIVGNCKKTTDVPVIFTTGSTLTNCTVSNVLAIAGTTSYGIFAVDFSVAENCSVLHCKCAGFYVDESEVKNCTASYCSSTGISSAGINLSEYSTALNCVVNNCHNPHYTGGGMFVLSSTARGCRISNCSASSGGGMWLGGESMAFDCTVDFCKSNQSGGGLYLENTTTARNCSINHCQSDSLGGGIYAAFFSVAGHCAIRSCSAVYGGGIYVRSNSTAENCTVGDCVANFGGGVAAYSASVLGTKVSGCAAAGGPGILEITTQTSNNLLWNNTTLNIRD